MPNTGDNLLRCRVCGLLQNEPPWGEDGKTPLFVYCDCCGVEFGYQDSTHASTVRYREAWLRSGAHWSEPKQGPSEWNLAKQLSQIPSEFKTSTPGDSKGARIVLGRPIREKRIQEEAYVSILFDSSEAQTLLHQILGLHFDLTAGFTISDSGGKRKIRIEGGYRGTRAELSRTGTQWFARLSQHELSYWCRFLSEIVLGTAQVDHIDLDNLDSPELGLTLRFIGPVVSVDEAEARRRLGT